LEISDPMSGFFMLKRSVFDAAVRKMSGQGSKMLFDLLASSPAIAVRTIPYQFRERNFGENKLEPLMMWEFMVLIADKLVGHIVPVRFVFFGFVGSVGVIVHFTILGLVFKVARLTFAESQSLAVIVATASNFFLNNLFTYRDVRLSGWQLFRGLLSFYLICLFGSVANVGIASYIFSVEPKWWLAGLGGILVGVVWNYAVTSVFTWKR
jgi:dolichol-phosphate mannosyltransferase